MRQRIAGHVFEQHGPVLTVRKSWWWYAAGCVLALVFCALGILFAANWLGDRNVYVGGTRGHRGRAIDPAHQTVWQKTRYYGLLTLFTAPFFLLPATYVLFGSREQRVPVRFDRNADRITHGRDLLCTVSAVVAIRLVESNLHFRGRGFVGGRTGVFAKLSTPPWSVELGCFSRLVTAERFGGTIGRFLEVNLYDDPLVPRHSSAPGFPVVATREPGPDQPEVSRRT